MDGIKICRTCKEYNCHKHNNSVILTITQRLQALAEHFTDTDQTMITYTEPDKEKNSSGINAAPEHIVKIEKTFSTSSLKSMEAMAQQEPITPMLPANNNMAMVPIRNNTVANNAIPNTIALIEKLSTEKTTSNNGVEKLSGKGYKSHEKHHFIKVYDSSFVSCTSPSGVYSEIAFILWLDNKILSKYAHSTDRYRFVISLMYDSDDDLWCVSAKLIKRASYYSTKDEEEGYIKNRLCRVDELRSEIKRILLYVGISPRHAYRLFRLNMSEELVYTNNDTGFLTIETVNHSKLLKDLEKPTYSNHGVYNNNRNHYTNNLYNDANQRRSMDMIYHGDYD